MVTGLFIVGNKITPQRLGSVKQLHRESKSPIFTPVFSPSLHLNYFFLKAFMLGWPPACPRKAGQTRMANKTVIVTANVCVDTIYTLVKINFYSNNNNHNNITRTNIFWAVEMYKPLADVQWHEVWMHRQSTSQRWRHAAFVKLADKTQQAVAVDNSKCFDLWHWPSVSPTPWPCPALSLSLSHCRPTSLAQGHWVRQRADA